MKKIIKNTILFGICALLFGSGAEAKIEEVNFSPSAQKLIVSGSFDRFGENIALGILKPGIEISQLSQMTAEGKKNAIVYFYNDKTKSDGSCSFEYSPKNAARGVYNVYVTLSDGEVYSDYALIADKDSCDNILALLNSADTAEKAESALRGNEFVIRGIADYEKLCASWGEESAIESISKILTGESYRDSNEIVPKIRQACFVAQLNKAENAENAAELVNNYSEVIGFSDNGIYKNLFKKDEVKFAGMLVGKDYTSIGGFITDFSDNVILSTINSLLNYEGVMTVMNAAENYLTAADYAGYNKLSADKKVIVQKAMVKNIPYASVSALTEAFNNAVRSAAYSSSNESGSGSGSGSGGGSGSGSSSGKNTSSSSGIGASTVTGSAEKGFKDLDKAEWAKESILKLYNKGIISGLDENTFDPQGRITREQFAKIIVMAYGLYDENAECSFDDVDSNAWYAPYIASAVKAGVVFGVDDRRFGTGRNITREDMAVIAFRAAALNENIEGAAFDDDETIADYAKTAVYSLKNYGVMSGKGNNLFEPSSFATRAEAAKMTDSLLTIGGNL